MTTFNYKVDWKKNLLESIKNKEFEKIPKVKFYGFINIII